MSFINELKQRNVIRVAILYGVASWLILQGADLIGSLLSLPDWTNRFVLLLLLLGFPAALVISWVYEITPEGIVKTSEVPQKASTRPRTGRRIDRMIIAALALAILVLLAERFMSAPEAIGPEIADTREPPGNGAAPATRSIAVLPFVNMSADPANEYFSDGMSEEILNTLAQVEGLRVAARTASFQFKGDSADLAEVGERLKVGAVLEGSVRRVGNSVRISAQLVDVVNGYRIWAKTFDRSLDNVFAVQTEIAGEIVDALQLELGATGGPAAATVGRALPTQNARAYELFLQGRHLWRQRSGPNIERALELLKAAVELDPEFAEAQAALASTHVVTANYLNVDATEAYDQAWDASAKAIELDPTLAEPYAVQAVVRFFRLEWLEAESGFRRAIEMQPDEPTPHHWFGVLNLAAGYLDVFGDEIRKAYELNPAHAGIASVFGQVRFYEGDYEAALEQLEVAESMGAWYVAGAVLPMVLYEMDRPNEALAATRRYAERVGMGADFAELLHAAMSDPKRRAEASSAILAASAAGYPATVRLHDLLRIGEYELAVSQALTAPNATPDDLLVYAWLPSRSDFRNSPEFERLVRESGLLDYWEKRGWPDLCRSDGEGFSCD